MRLSIAALSFALACAPALAQNAAQDAAPIPQTMEDYSTLQQVELTEDQVKRYVDSLDDMQKAMGDLPADAAEPDAKSMAKLEAIAKKHGFRNFDEYNVVAGNISLVVDGIDPDAKTFVGQEKLIARGLDEIKADSKMSAADKATATKDLEAQMKAVVPIKYKSNIDLVLKYYDKINGG